MCFQTVKKFFPENGQRPQNAVMRWDFDTPVTGDMSWK
jgi:hypothetical protein